ncbi:MAG TPA: signal peptide peptidase SppA [Caulobacteraceae bacterium]|nr:signal peptide peptidase SppA [Caulobacteraceae bacterium]
MARDSRSGASMKQFLLTLAGVFVGLTLFFIGVPFLLISMALGGAHAPTTPAASALVLDLRGPLTDQEPETLLGVFGQHPLSVMRIVETLKRAQTDPRVKALFVRLPDAGIDPGEADELSLAVRAFHDAGKPVVAFSQGLYPEGVVTSTYMLGAAADQFWMQPGAPFQATGIASQSLFFKRLFDKYGVKADFEQRYEYKTAINGYLYDDFTPAQREADLSWMGSVYDSALSAAARYRRMDPARLKALIEGGPYDAADAQAKGLIDRLGDLKAAEDEAAQRAGDGAKLFDFDDYASAIDRNVDGFGRPQIGVVSAEGDITTGSDGATLGGQDINADEVASALYAAAQDNSIKAVVFRLNSPGGADTASEEILAAVRAVKAAKPIVVSMGTYGASGGYWVSSAASAIVAEPSTLTGSIGVFGGKLAIGPALAHFGVDLRDLSVGGPYADADSPAGEFTATQRAAFAASVDRVYAGFIQRVATGRRMTPDQVRAIARGRVWTGVQAKGLGLVDELGGFYQAVDKAKDLAGLSGQDVELKALTARRTPWEALRHAFGVADTELKTLQTASEVLNDPRARGLVATLADARRRSGGELLLAPVPRF